MPCRSSWTCVPVNIFALTTLIVLANLGCANHSGVGTTDVGKTAPVDDTDPAFIVPDGNPKAILEFAKELANRQPKSTNEKQWYANAVKTQKALIAAGDKIMAQNVEDTTLKEAVKFKLLGTIQLAMIQNQHDKKASDRGKKALELVNTLRKDPRPVVAETANEAVIAARKIDLRTMSQTERTQLAEDALKLLDESKASPQSVGDVYFLAEDLVSLGENEQAASMFDHIANSLKQANVSEAKAFAVKIRGKANALRLPGSQLEIEGSLFDGGELDWKSYRGKVVLVDFWATWCGPCIGELPNVKANYEKYHDLGFDVVGISLDHDRKALERFLKDNPLPWAQLFDGDNATKRNGWQHPMAVKFGVSSIPTAYLVDRDGKVVSIEVRGDELGHQLKKLLESKG